MCKFCDNIKNRDIEFAWLVRSTYADDNICEYINDNSCEHCEGCNMKFKLRGYEINDNTYISVEYEHKMKDKNGNEVIIRPFSEGVQFNYCPFCGKQISKKVMEFEDISRYKIEINKVD